ncbi:MAG: restriction endonuclease subunit S [Myxococcota bacterium]
MVLKPVDSVKVDYFTYLFKSQGYIRALQSTAEFIRDGQDLNFGNFSRVDLPLVPMDEQSAISRFLDHADRLIKKYIRAKQKLIKLLEEQKQAIIHRAVTRGLDPNVKLKPSGVAWLGDVPEGWEVKRLGNYITDIEQGWSPVAAEGDVSEEQWSVLTLSSIRRGIFNPLAAKPISKSAEVPKHLLVCDGDFLLTRSNTRERVGDACVVENALPRTIMSDLIYRLRLDCRALQPEFLLLQLLSSFGRTQIEKDARGASGTMPKISQGHVRSWRILVPPIDEQKVICDRVSRDLTYIERGIELALSELSLLREYRTRLIADVVTGKLDVREAVASLPDVLDEADGAGEEEPAVDEADDGDVDGGDSVLDKE